MGAEEEEAMDVEGASLGGKGLIFAAARYRRVISPVHPVRVYW
jgi:hypothetical protein